MKSFIYVFAAMLALALSGCGGSGGGAPGDATGDWAGTYKANRRVNGSVGVRFTQDGNLLTGTVIVVNTNGTVNGNITGQIFGDNARFGGTIGAYGDVTYTGTTTNGTSMSGSFTG